MAPPRNRRPGFSRRAQYGLFLSYVAAGSGLLLAVVLLLLSRFDPPLFAAMTRATAEVTTPVSSALDWARRGVGSIPEGIGSYFGVRSENARLKQQLAAQRAAIERALTLDRENQRLRAMLKLRDITPETIVIARLVNSSASSTRRYATLNAGSWQGVQQGQPVREAAGLIGQVIEVGPNTARVLLITDPESTVPVRRVRDGMPAIAAGRGDGTLDVRSASVANMVFAPGDRLVTSGAGGIFPPNIPVATVTRIGRDVAFAQPNAHPDTPDFAMVQKIFLPEPPTPAPFPTATVAPRATE
ncbi:rod shape-determining protein MreC [Sphingomonas sp. RS6]